MTEIRSDVGAAGNRPLTLYQFRCLDVPTAEAVAAVAACGAVLGSRYPARRGGFALPIPGGRLMLRPAPLSGASKGERLCFAGRLRSRFGMVSVPVELVVEPWSDSRGELGLRPVGPACLRSPACARAFDRLGTAALDALEQLVASPFLAPVPAQEPVAVPAEIAPIATRAG